VVGATYDDTSGILEKQGETLKWGDVYHMFKKSSFSTDAKDQDELKIFKNIKRSGIFRVASHVVVFPYVDAIIWIIKHINLRNKYIFNARGDPIASFQPEDLGEMLPPRKRSEEARQ
jgi:hypothetical protein